MSVTTDNPAPAGPSRLEGFLVNGGVVLVLLVLVVAVSAAVEPRFLNKLNLMNMGRNFAFLAIPALAQMLVMTTGGFDLSLGAVVASGSVVSALVMRSMGADLPEAGVAPVLAALAAALALGLAIGAFNGWLVARFNISAFMVTLATASAIVGVVLFQTQGIPIYGVSEGFIDLIGRGRIGPVPYVALIALALVALGIVMQRGTRFGRHIYAVGSDARAALLSGVPRAKVLIATYALAGALAGVTGFLMTARLGSGQGTIAETLAMQTIAAAVIGGVSLRGGVARAELVALAALFLTVMANAMNLMRIDSKFQTLVLGLVLLGALALERLVLREKTE
ncbi:ABC transporter permease [Salipiger bermudensis]|uniref:ABC transporter permease n=1 Tax=Salipiger bermudensis TaxID=344736 RepID=UPI001C995086|nr:ABC transporter permease [Salipiger bermudensis]MBY6005297.1 ABC transporter permease [Salipiger bermudensis]